MGGGREKLGRTASTQGLSVLGDSRRRDGERGGGQIQDIRVVGESV